ncbi:hypothetical protein [Providencia huaxiensis]|nr:hypothetical protein [Providencia huaxiensis]
MRFTTNLTPVKNIEKCEKLKALLNKPEIKKEIYYGGVEFKCISILDEK